MQKEDYLYHLGITNYILQDTITIQNTLDNSYVIDIQEKIIILLTADDIINHQNLLDKILRSFNINDKIFITSNIENYSYYTMQQDKIILILDDKLAQKILKINDDNLRNKIYEVNSNKIIVSLSLRYLVNNPLEKAKAWMDFIMLKNLLI